MKAQNRNHSKSIIANKQRRRTIANAFIDGILDGIYNYISRYQYRSSYHDDLALRLALEARRHRFEQLKLATTADACLGLPDAARQSRHRGRCDHPFLVGKHVRTLPKGRKISSAKKATALENGFHLQAGQTWVKEYKKGDDAT